MELKKQFEAVSLELKEKESSIPESVSSLIDVFTIQIKDLRKSIETQTKTIETQTQTIQTLIQELEKIRQEKLKNDEIIKTLKTLLKSKAVDIDALKRLLFQGGREQKKDSSTSSNKTPKSDNKKNSSPRNRQSNSEKTKDCSITMSRYLTKDGDTLNAKNEEDASKEIPQVIELQGQKFRFKCWKKSNEKVEIVKTTTKITNYVPEYEPFIEASNETATTNDSVSTEQKIMGINPEKDFLPKTVIGFSLMAMMAEERMQNRLPMNRIANAVSVKDA